MTADPGTVGFRLQTVKGHLDGVIPTVDEVGYSIELLDKFPPVQDALDRARRDLLAAYLRECTAATGACQHRR
jgi:DNA-binding FrmR family transcriptional regulator